MPLEHLIFEDVGVAATGAGGRMDVAGFVGYCRRGPTDTPVAIDDPAGFDAIFGGEATLHWHRDTWEAHRAYLRAAVHAFFANGGRRCWVVRTADEGAASNRYLVPGLMRCLRAAGYGPAVLQARSKGSWSDALRVGATLRAVPLGDGAVEVGAGALEVQVQKSRRDRVSQGDLLRLRFPDGLLLFLAADRLQGTSTRDAGVEARHAWRVRGRQAWFLTNRALPAAASAVVARAWPTREGMGPGPDLRGHWLAANGPTWQMAVRAVPETAPHPGVLMTLIWGTKPFPLLSVQEMRPATWAERQQWGWPAEESLVLSGRQALWPLSPDEGQAKASRLAAAERLSCDLWVDDGEGTRLQMADLGLTDSHPRFVGFLPDDDSLFRVRGGSAGLPDGDNPGAELRASALQAGFPVAADRNPDGSDDTAGLYVPIGLPTGPAALCLGPAVPGTAPAQVRDGLGSFSPMLFCDSALAMTPAAMLRHEMVSVGRRHGRAARGLHALWDVEEVTLLCLPDSVHDGWQWDATEQVLHAPVLEQAGRNAAAGAETLRWTAVDGASAYRLQCAADIDFEQMVTDRIMTGDAAAVSLPTEGGPHSRWCRVRAESGRGFGPWSNALFVRWPPADFRARDIETVPELTFQRSGPHRFTLQWTAAPGAEYELQVGTDPDMHGAPTAYRGPDLHHSVVPEDTPVYCRVRAWRHGRAGAWSRGRVLDGNEGPRRYEARDLAPGADDPTRSQRLDLHAAALRFCAARGDVLAILALPASYGDLHAAAHSRALAAQLAEEEHCLRSGALYHPWPRATTGDLHAVPPDGAMAGQFAAQALGPGVWMPPINLGLSRTEGVLYTVRPEAAAVLRRERINIVERSPAGVAVATADTLSPEPGWRSAAVRRLMSLIRAQVRREGELLLFGPDEPALRLRAAARFQRLLGDLYSRGALVGARAEEAFGVTVSPLPEAAGFSVDLRIAPSRPLRFLTLRLVRGPDDEFAVTEA